MTLLSIVTVDETLAWIHTAETGASASDCSTWTSRMRSDPPGWFRSVACKRVATVTPVSVKATGAALPSSVTLTGSSVRWNPFPAWMVRLLATSADPTSALAWISTVSPGWAPSMHSWNVPGHCSLGKIQSVGNPPLAPAIPGESDTITSAKATIDGRRRMAPPSGCGVSIDERPAFGRFRQTPQMQLRAMT